MSSRGTRDRGIVVIGASILNLVGIIVATVSVVVAVTAAVWGYTRFTSVKLGPLSLDVGRIESDYREHLSTFNLDEIEGDLKEEIEGAQQDERSYKLIREYAVQGLTQAKISFWFSIIFASIGFMIIGSSLIFVDRNQDVSQQSAAAFALIAGAIVDAVAGLFFVQANRSRR